jgi:hypothetical protein
MARGFDLELFEAAYATAGLAAHACSPSPQQPDRWPLAQRALGRRRVRGRRLYLPVVYLDPVARTVRMIVSHIPHDGRPAA